MTLVRLLRYAPEATTGLCRTCVWGTVRKGYRANEAETFCRLVGPNARVLYAVRECTDYGDRRVQMTASEARRYGFVTELKLDEAEAVKVYPDDETVINQLRQYVGLKAGDVYPAQTPHITPQFPQP